MIENVQNTNFASKNQAAKTSKAQQQFMDRKIFEAFKINAGSKTAYMPTGHLIKSKGPIGGLAVGIKDTFSDVKNFAGAVKNGKSNDHSLGRMNDLGLKLGGALIAGYLASKKMAPTSKGMEFIGFGAFLASMALWPRLTIDAPIKAKNGFNIRQKYIDNEGRKKEFFQDNQYLPWDLWSNEKINKIADRMHIDKNMKDREEFTKKKMQKIALQGNTEWMLSCGVGVPLMTSMICTAAEKPLELFNIKRAIKKSQKNLELMASGNKSVADYAHEIKDSGLDFTKLKGSADKKAERIFEELDPMKLVKQAKDQDSRHLIEELRYSNSLMDDIRQILTPKYIDSVDDFTTTLLDKVFKGGKVKSVNLLGDTVEKVISSDALKAVVEKANVQDGRNFAEKLLEAMKDAQLPLPTGMGQEEFVSGVTDLIQQNGLGKKSEAEALALLSRNGKAIKALQRKTGKLFEAVNSVFGARAESAATLRHSNFASSVLEQTGIKKNMALLKEIKETSGSGKAFDTLRKFFSKSAGYSDKEYADAFIELAGGKGPKGLLGKKIQSIFGYLDKNSKSTTAMKDALGKLGSETASLEGMPTLKNMYGGGRSGLKNIVSKFMHEARLNFNSTSHRALATLDFEKRVADSAAVKKFVKQKFGTADLADDFIEIARKTIYEGTKSGYSSAERFVKAGKVNMWKEVLDFLYNQPLADSTKKAIAEAAKMQEGAGISSEAKNIISGFNKYRSKVFDALKSSGESIPSKENFLLTGKPITQTLQEASKKLYNNKHWLKIFGIATIVAVAVTTVATFTFGRMKKEQELYEQQSKEDGNVTQ